MNDGDERIGKTEDEDAAGAGVPIFLERSIRLFEEFSGRFMGVALGESSMVIASN